MKMNSSERWFAKPQAGEHIFPPEINKVPKLLVYKQVKSCPGCGDIFTCTLMASKLERGCTFLQDYLLLLIRRVTETASVWNKLL